MTLCVAWVRKRKREESLYMIADSRLTGGDTFDGCPKLYPLSREDCAIACAGATWFSAPVAEHIQRAIDLNIKLRTRASDFLDIVHSIEDITNKCLSQVKDTTQSTPDFQMILAGYSVRLSRFCVRIIEYNKKTKKMYAHKVPTIKKNVIAVIGDHDKNINYVTEYRVKLHKALGDETTIDMQPLDILMEFIEDSSKRSVGGNPQMLKLTKFLRVLPYGIYQTKTNGDKDLSFYGRSLMNYETFPYPIYNMDTHQIGYMKEISDEFRRDSEDIRPLDAFVKWETEHDNNE